jgi:hypothetical protein
VSHRVTYLFLHGQGGNKEEAAVFAEIAFPAGWQVLGVTHNFFLKLELHY